MLITFLLQGYHIIVTLQHKAAEHCHIVRTKKSQKSIAIKVRAAPKSVLLLFLSNAIQPCVIATVVIFCLIWAHLFAQDEDYVGCCKSHTVIELLFEIFYPKSCELFIVLCYFSD